MARPKLKQPLKSRPPAVVVERIFHLLLSIIVVGVIYRYCWLDFSDPFKCGAILNTGEWLDRGFPESSRNPFQNWQPSGCMMYEYKKADIEDCFHNQKLVFIGDSTTRQIFWAVAKKMDLDKAEEGITETLDLDQKHKDLELTSAGVTLRFVWDPWLNSTGLKDELSSFRVDPTTAAADNETTDSASLILLGAPGLWHARHGEENHFKHFRDSIDAVIPYMDHSTQQMTKSKPFSIRSKSPNFLLLAPVQVPWYPALSPSREETITPEKIDQMNEYLQQVSAHSSADVIWSFSLMTWAGRRGAYEESGLHVVDNVAHRKADVVLNLRCNAGAAAKGYPFNRTCCTNYKRPAKAQWVIILLGMLVLPALSLSRGKYAMRVRRLLPPADILKAVMTFSLVLCLCFYTDRTQVFEKAHKQFREREFLTACLAVAIIGILSIRKSKIPVTSDKATLTSLDKGFLSRDQTNEWKGWMQFFILLYHYTHASKTLRIYEVVRLLVASYLFMTGFGHTLYFLKRDDYSLKRVASVLLRLNLLSCTLPYMMRTDYVFYYFAPLVSFWFLVIYLTLKIRRHENSNLFALHRKILISATLATGFIMLPGILEFVSSVLEYACRISLNAEKWRFRTFLDMYIVYVGMIVASLYHHTSRLTSGHATPKTVLESALQCVATNPRIFRRISVLTSLIFLPGFWMLTGRSPNREDYDWWQPYISFIPILSFVVLRNSHRVLRNYHSKVFVWLGRFSLETYVLQYHIWLAGDTTGLLRLGLWGRLTEAAILTATFLWIGWVTAEATQKLASWIAYGNGHTSQDGYNKLQHYEDQTKLKLSPMLPTVQDREGKLSKEEGPSMKKRGIRAWAARTASSSGQDLRWRIGLIALVMWVGNITYG